jgi:beta-glucosidase
MKKLVPFIFILFIYSSLLHAQKYKDASLSSVERTEDLISRMTIEEKVGQLLCPMGWEMYEKDGDKICQSSKFEKLVEEQHIGSLWAVYRADPWTKKTLKNGLNPELAAKAGNALQKYVIENTRLEIPLFLAEEAPHGHMAVGTTVFPTGIGMASSWSTKTLEKVGKVIGEEVRLQGGHIAYGPVIDLSREPRWSRVEETFGEDPVLSGTLAAAEIKGEGAGDLTQPYSVISTLKHFVAYGIPTGGHNGSPSVVTPMDLYSNVLPPFKQAIEAGAKSVMTSYNSMNGIPSTANRTLLTDILRNQWHFDGFVVSDLFSIEGIHQSHYVASTIQSAAIMAANAGVDMDLGGDAYRNLVDAIKNGKIKETTIDAAVAHILRLKFEMGLFENPYVNPEEAKKNVRAETHIQVAREIAQESIVLLKNKNNILPLNKWVRKVAVIGPNADNMYNMLGDYTAPQDSDNIKTVLEGVLNKIGTKNVQYVKGCAIRDTMHTNINEATEAAQNADVAIVVVGGSSARDFKTKYIETGAAIVAKDQISDMESGEGFDRSTLILLGKQMELLKRIKATGRPMVVIYIQGRPMNMNWAEENADALLTAWYPGQEGGNAIADVLFGDYNPAGRLPVSIPKNVGQLPVYYNQPAPIPHDYVETTAAPLFEFGYGLSYSTFSYTNLKIKKTGKNLFDISFTVTNTGKYDGDEVPQLYLRDEYASTVQPIKQLKHFDRIHLTKGENKVVHFKIDKDDLSILNVKLEKVIEPGNFIVMIGASSNDIRLTGKLIIE